MNEVHIQYPPNSCGEDIALRTSQFRLVVTNEQLTQEK